MTKPLKSKLPVTRLLNPAFVYTRSDLTDLKARFERERMKMGAENMKPITRRNP